MGPNPLLAENGAAFGRLRPNRYTVLEVLEVLDTDCGCPDRDPSETKCSLAPRARLELATYQLTADRSTIELPGKKPVVRRISF